MRQLAAFLCFLSLAFAAFAEQPKNVIFILADDLGWNDTSIYQENSFFETPNIDALAQKGMVFTHAFSNSPLCSPTRASILTGQTPARHGILNPNIETSTVRLTALQSNTGPRNQPSTAPLTATRLDNSLPTLAKVLKTKGYLTAHFGKWHLGASPYSPLEHGFDIDIPHFSGSGPYGGYLAPWSFAPDLAPETKEEHIDIRLAKEAKKWILNNHRQGPFFVNFWPFSVHAPFEAKKDVVNHFINKRSPFNSQRSATYAGMIKHFDDAISILYEALEEAGLEDDTIIILTSDNGGNMYDVLGEIYPTSNFPLRGGKATQYNGGSRVPTFIIWPGLTQSNTLSNEPIQSADFYPTLLSGLNAELPDNYTVDGKDIRPLLRGETFSPRAIFTYYPTMPRVPEWLPPSATVLYDGWKLIKTFYYGNEEAHRYALYYIVDDVDETHNLAKDRPDKLIELDNILSEYLASSGAALPLQNPDYQQGRFNFNAIGKPALQYILPEEKTAANLTLYLFVSDTIADAGDKVSVSWNLLNGSNTSSITYRQFMGPEVTIETQNDGFSFIAPEVNTAQFISFAFIAKDNARTVRKQLGIKVLPMNSAPTIRLSNTEFVAQKGSKLTINYTVNDINKDKLFLRVQSDDFSLDENINIARPVYQFDIPPSFSQSEANIVFIVSDGLASNSNTVRVTFSDSESEGKTDVGVKGTENRGGSVYILIPILFVALGLKNFLLRQKVILKN